MLGDEQINPFKVIWNIHLDTEAWISAKNPIDCPTSTVRLIGGCGLLKASLS